MRRDEDIDAVVSNRPFERLEGNLLQQSFAPGIGNDLLLDPVAAVCCSVDEPKGRNALLDHVDFMNGVSLLFGKIAVPIGDDQTHIARTGGIDARIVNFVQDAVTDREPNAAACRKRSSNPTLGARRPAGRQTWRARRFDGISVCHRTSAISRSWRHIPEPTFRYPPGERKGARSRRLWVCFMPALAVGARNRSAPWPS